MRRSLVSRHLFFGACETKVKGGAQCCSRSNTHRGNKGQEPPQAWPSNPGDLNAPSEPFLLPWGHPRRDPVGVFWG